MLNTVSSIGPPSENEYVVCLAENPINCTSVSKVLQACSLDFPVFRVLPTDQHFPAEIRKTINVNSSIEDLPSISISYICEHLDTNLVSFASVSETSTWRPTTCSRWFFNVFDTGLRTASCTFRITICSASFAGGSCW